MDWVSCQKRKQVHSDDVWSLKIFGVVVDDEDGNEVWIIPVFHDDKDAELVVETISFDEFVASYKLIDQGKIKRVVALVWEAAYK